MSGKVLIFSSLLVSCICQRAPYAGKRPIGFPALEAPSTTVVIGLDNKFGEGDGGTSISTTTQRLPVEALGDRDLVDRLSKLPIDKQPFWFINWQALEEHRKKPQTFPQKVNPFIENNSNQQQIQTQVPNQFVDQTQNRFGQAQNTPQNSFINSGQSTQNFPSNSFNGMQVQPQKRPQNFNRPIQTNFHNGVNIQPLNGNNHNQGVDNFNHSKEGPLTNLNTGLENRFQGETEFVYDVNGDKIQSQKRKPEYYYE